METKELISKVRDLFGEVYIGGSYAVDTILGNEIKPESDIDFYIDYKFCTRYMLKKMIEVCLFENCMVTWTCRPEGNHEYYKMPDIRKRLSVEVYFPATGYNIVGKTKRFDFIFVKDLNLDFLMRNQASNATMCCLKLDFSDKGYTEHKHHRFTECHDDKILDVNIHEDWCTPQHRQKLYAKYHGYKLNEYSTPRNKALDKIVKQAQSLNW